jgi:hypothetical protein
MTPKRIVALLFAALLTIAIVWAMGQKPIGESFAAMIRDPWGVVTLIDLYAGFIAFALVIALYEKPWVAAVLFVLLCVLGNIISLGWLAFRGFRIIESRLGRAETP